MELETDDNIIQTCLRKIEDQLGWGNGEDWSTLDFESLSTKIQQSTGVTLSVATLKRLWGKIRYDSKPTVTTLNALSQFVGYENWQAFRQNQVSHSNSNGFGKAELKPTISPESNGKNIRWLWLIVVIAAIAAAYLFFAKDSEPAPLNPDNFTFSSKKVVGEGVPNTVIFDYDATAASSTDSVFIQQSWDKRLSTLVSKKQHQHTSIYYIPGFFEAKLRINQTVVKEHNLMITTKGWLPLIDQKPVPVYFKQSDAMSDGTLRLTTDQLKDHNVQLQPTSPHVGFYNMGDFGDIRINDMIFESRIKNDYAEGGNACQFTEIRIQFEGAALILPLSAMGCVSELNFLNLDGKTADLSTLGCDFSDWVNVKVDFNPDSFKVSVQGKSLDFPIKSKRLKFVGIGIQFQGTGSIDMIRITNHQGQIQYEENF